MIAIIKFGNRLGSKYGTKVWEQIWNEVRPDGREFTYDKTSGLATNLKIV